MGKIVHLHRKSKSSEGMGLPKLPVASANVTKEGLDGDYNYYRHDSLDNTPDQALLVMTMDKIRELNNEGWPIKAGDIGENLTVDGMNYDDFKPGLIFRAGSVEFEITYKCDPCKNLYKLSYVGKEKGSEFVKTMINRRGWYAKVLKEGTLTSNLEIIQL